MLFAYFVAKGFGREDFNRGTMFGNIEQQFTVIGVGKFKDIRARRVK
jgi:hypothetical protein